MGEENKMIDKINPWMAASSAITNPLFAHFTNVKNRKFSREMYKTQRQDALADWAMQNEYNSPRAQMQRFQEAGLNPHLIYGQQNEGATVRSSSSSGGQASAPEMDTRGLMAGYDMRLKSAQADQLSRVVTQQMEDQHNKTLAEIIQIQSNTNKANLDAEGIKLDNALKDRLQDIHVEQAGATLRKTLVDTQFTLNHDDREAAKTAQSLAEGVERILLSKAHRGQIKISNDKLKEEIANLKKDGKIKDFDVKLTEQNIRPGDPVWYRTVGTLINEILTRLGLNQKHHPNQLPGESLEEYRRRKAVGKHQ